MDPISQLSELVKNLDSITPNQTEHDERGYKTIRLRADVHEALEGWKTAWSDKNMSEVVLRLMTLAKGELLSNMDVDPGA